MSSGSVALGLVLFLLLYLLIRVQVYLVQMVRRRSDDEEEGGASDVDGHPLARPIDHAVPTTPGAEERDGALPDPGLCPSCGRENDPFYTYCGSCVQRLRSA